MAAVTRDAAPLRWEGAALLVLDQRRLPAEEAWIRCDTPEALKGPLPSLEAAFIYTIQEAGHLPYRDWER